MDKLKKALKNLFAPAIALLLVVAAGVFTPVVSVAAALQLSVAAAGASTKGDVTISKLPAHTVKVGTEIVEPTVSTGTIEFWHAGSKLTVSAGDTYFEEGQYEWRFYLDGVLYDTYTVLATKTAYTMTLSTETISVAPKDLSELKLPLPASYTVDGVSMDATVEKVENEHYAKVTLKKNKQDAGTVYRLYVSANLDNNALESDKFSFDSKNVTIDMNGHQTAGILKVTYTLKDETGTKNLVAANLNDGKGIEIKKENRADATFASAPKAPTSIDLGFYQTKTITAPTVGQAKVKGETFDVEGQTTIAKVQAYLYSSKPSDWNASNVHTVNVTDGVVDDAIVEVDGLKVKTKKLGYYRFQFKTTTAFGYKLENSIDGVEQSADGSYVTYWSDPVLVSYDAVSPSFAWVKNYTESDINQFNEDFDNLNQLDAAIPAQSAEPEVNTNFAEQKYVVNFTQGLTLPALFPHDNATGYSDLTVTDFTIRQVRDAQGKKASQTVTKSEFNYDQTKQLKINFDDAGTSSDNIAVLKANEGLYRVTITVRQKTAKYEDEDKDSTTTYYNTYTKDFYFYATSASKFPYGVDGTNAPVIDAGNSFQVSDVYLRNGSTFTFKTPTITDEHTPNLQIDYYLTNADLSLIKKLDYTAGATSITVDLADHNVNNSGDYYIYAVARNFNGMQDALSTTATNLDFNTANLTTDDTKKSFGYAWKRAAFKVHATNEATHTATVTATFASSTATDYVAGKQIKISNIAVDWSGSDAVASKLQAKVYRVKEGKKLDPVKLYNGYDADAEEFETVSFKANTKSYTELAFTPSVSGTYLLVVTAQEMAGDKTFNHITEIQIDGNNDRYGVFENLIGDATVNETVTLPGCTIYNENGKKAYVSRGLDLYSYDDSGVRSVSPVGSCEITGKYVDGSTFTPKAEGNYVITYKFYDNSNHEILKKNLTVHVNAANTSTQILMGEQYKGGQVLWGTTDTTYTGADAITVAGKTYKAVKNDDNENIPAYAITLQQFIDSNTGAGLTFTVDSASLYDYLEPIWNGTKITGYRYPAIAIPMANVTSGNTASDEVVITVQKSGNSDYYYVSSKDKKAGAGKNTDSVISQINDFYVFRPEGTFGENCKDATKYNAKNYVLTANSKNGVSGTYTVSYKADEAKTFSITFGNQNKGELSWNQGFLTYGDGKDITEDTDTLTVEKDSDGHRYVTINLSKVFFEGNADMLDLINEGPNGDKTKTDGFNPDADPAIEYYWKNVAVSLVVDGKTVIYSGEWSTKGIVNHDDYTLKFDLETYGSGEYSVNISMDNPFAPDYDEPSNSINFSFNKEASDAKSVNLNNVWGTILIVLSVGLLAGVIFYFVKTARATRFVDAPRGMKKDKKDDKKADAAKDEEAPKNDAK